MGQEFPSGNLGRKSLVETSATDHVQHSLLQDTELTDIFLLGEAQLMEAEDFVVACERCEEHAEISFDYLLDAVTGCDPAHTEYLMPRAAHCPQCRREVTEKTLIIPA